MEKLRARPFRFVCLSVCFFCLLFKFVYFQIFNTILYNIPIKRNHLIIIQCSTIVSSFRNTFARNLHAIFCADLNIFFATFCFVFFSLLILYFFFSCFHSDFLLFFLHSISVHVYLICWLPIPQIQYSNRKFTFSLLCVFFRCSSAQQNFVGPFFFK